MRSFARRDGKGLDQRGHPCERHGGGTCRDGLRAFAAPLRIAPVAALLLALAAGCSPGSGGDVEIWRFAIEEIEGSVQHAYASEFERRIEAGSSGAIRVEIYPYGSLGSSVQLTEQVQSGAIQLAFASPGHLGSVVPEAQVFSLHFLLSDDETTNLGLLAHDGTFGGLLAEAYREHGLELLSIVPEGWMVWTANRALREPADFSGLKMRTMASPLLVESYAVYGASPTPMPYAEVYSGLQLGMIDAQVNPVFAIEEMSFDEVQSHMTFARHAPFVTTLVAHPGFVAGLDEARRALLHTTVAGLESWADETQRDFNATRLEKIRAEGGTELVELDDAQRARFRELSLPVRALFVEMTGARGQAMLDALGEALRSHASAAGS